MGSDTRTLRIKVTPGVARIVDKEAPRELQLSAAGGALPLSGKELVTALLFLCHSNDAEIRSKALATCREVPASVLSPVLTDPEAAPQLLHFIARQRSHELAVMEPLLTNPAVSEDTLVYVAGHGEGRVLSLVAHNEQRQAVSPRIVAALLANPQADRALKLRLGWEDPAQAGEPCGDADSPAGGNSAADETADPEVAGGDAEEETVEEEINFSKYQQALEFGVADKIKMAMSGDKEWRTIFLKDANKLVSSAVLKNPRITDGEILTVAKNKSSNDELIRLITMNKDWIKNYEIKKALIMHPKTPLPKALRYMNYLGDKDIKQLAKSRNVSQVLVNNARRMLLAKEKKGR